MAGLKRWTVLQSSHVLLIFFSSCIEFSLVGFRVQSLINLLSTGALIFFRTFVVKIDNEKGSLGSLPKFSKVILWIGEGPNEVNPVIDWVFDKTSQVGVQNKFESHHNSLKMGLFVKRLVFFKEVMFAFKFFDDFSHQVFTPSVQDVLRGRFMVTLLFGFQLLKFVGELKNCFVRI